MEDNKIWFYIIAAVIYFLTRKKKKKDQPQPQTQKSRPTEANRPQQKQKPVSFEDLLKEITAGKVEEEPEPEVYEEPEPVYQEELKNDKKEKERIRHFADEESRRVYEESIARAEAYEPGHDHKFESNFKASEDTEPTLADEIREGLQTTDSARKAIIYSEILNRRY